MEDESIFFTLGRMFRYLAARVGWGEFIDLEKVLKSLRAENLLMKGWDPFRGNPVFLKNGDLRVRYEVGKYWYRGSCSHYDPNERWEKYTIFSLRHAGHISFTVSASKFEYVYLWLAYKQVWPQDWNKETREQMAAIRAVVKRTVPATHLFSMS